jgi:hypothetical protein
MYIHTYSSPYRDAGWAEESSECHMPKKSFHMHKFDSHVLVPCPKQYIYKNGTVTILYTFMI